MFYRVAFRGPGSLIIKTMDLPDETYQSFTPYRQEGVTQNPEYYARNAYWKPPDFKKGKIFLHERTGTLFKRMTDTSFLEHIGVGRQEGAYYMKIPSSTDAATLREELAIGAIVLRQIGGGNQVLVVTMNDFFTDGPLRKLGYIRVSF